MCLLFLDVITGCDAVKRSNTLQHVAHTSTHGKACKVCMVCSRAWSVWCIQGGCCPTVNNKHMQMPWLNVCMVLGVGKKP